jgi:hypothetical protein
LLVELADIPWALADITPDRSLQSEILMTSGPPPISGMNGSVVAMFENGQVLASRPSGGPMKREMPPNVSFLSGRDTAPAYWMYNILWVPLIEGHQTAGSFSVIEQWMRKDAGALVPHVYNLCDEWFYTIEDAIDFTVSGERVPCQVGRKRMGR